jgi:hypothetical protein
MMDAVVAHGTDVRPDRRRQRGPAQRVGGFSDLQFIETPATIADQWRSGWSQAAGASSSSFRIFRAVDDSVDHLVPELQRRDLLRCEYEGKTLAGKLSAFLAREPVFPGAVMNTLCLGRVTTHPCAAV